MITNNSFVKVAISINGEDWKKAVLKAYDGKIYLLSHTRRTFEELPEGINKHGMLGGVSVEANTRENWSYYDGVSTYANGVLVSMSLDPETVVSVHSRPASTSPRTRRSTSQTAAPAMVESAPAANPYILPGYTASMYDGFASYHASHRVTMNTPLNYRGYRVGVELETEFASSRAHKEFTDTPRNWYFCESDGSLNGYGCEIITIPLTPADAMSRNTWRPLVKRLAELGATSWDNNRCGLHVHIGREILGDTESEREATLSRLLLFYNLYLNDDATSNKVFGRSQCYHESNHDRTQELAAVKCLGVSVLKDKDVAKRVGDAMKRKQNGERYYTINTTNAATIEFRKGRGSLNADRIQTIVTFCVSVCLYVKTTDDVSALTVDGFRDFIRATVPATNALYHYYDVVDRDL